MPLNSLLKTQQVAQAMGVSVSTIKRWVDSGSLAAARTVGKHRLISLGEALRFAREQALPHARLQMLLEVDAPAHPTSGDESVEALFRALETGRSAEARTLIGSAYAQVRQAPQLADDLIRPAMERIGEKWQEGALDIYQEHRASRIVEAALMDLIGRVSAANSRPAIALAIGATPEGDLSTLPGLLCELTLRELGWDVMNMGPNLPLESLANAVHVHRPRLVWLSINHVISVEKFLHDYRVFFAATSSTGTAVCLGGLALSPELRARLVAASFGDRMAHLAEFARRLMPATDRQATATESTLPSPSTSTDED